MFRPCGVLMYASLRNCWSLARSSIAACSYSPTWASETFVVAVQPPAGAGWPIRFLALVLPPYMSPATASITSPPFSTRYSFASSRTTLHLEVSSALPSNWSVPVSQSASTVTVNVRTLLRPSPSVAVTLAR